MGRYLEMNRICICVFALLAFALKSHAGRSLSDSDLKLLQDPGGWEYVTVSDVDAGIQTKHTCFDGRPHPEECSGTLRFAPDNSFVKSIHIHGETVDRHGTYKLEDEKIAFFDEFGTEDGPYSLQLNPQTKHLILEMPQLKMELELESQYRDEMRAHKRGQ